MATASILRETLDRRWRAVTSGPFFQLADPPAEFLEGLPGTYLGLIADFGGREGFLGETYLRLYRLNELVAFNAAYNVPSSVPEVVLFGSDGSGYAFGFRVLTKAVVRIPFIPLVPDAIEFVAADFGQFILSLAASAESAALNPKTVGLEVHEKHPVAFGGDPVDPANKVIVPPSSHAEFCRFWNQTYRRLRAERAVGKA